MTIEQLTYFTVICETLNYTRAAELLHVSQSALSLQISKLERELGCTLLYRTTRSVLITAAGEHLRQRALHILSEVDALPEEVSAVETGTQGTLTLGYYNLYEKGIYERIIKKIRREHPNLLIIPKKVDTIDFMLSLDKQGVDGILLPAPCVKGMGWIEAITLEKGGLGLLVGEDSRFYDREHIGIQEVANEKLILFSRQLIPRLYDQMIADFYKHKCLLHNVLHISDPTAIISLVKAGYGNTLVSQAQHEWEEGSKWLPITELSEGYDLLFCYPQMNAKPGIAYVIEAINQHCLELKNDY